MLISNLYFSFQQQFHQRPRAPVTGHAANGVSQAGPAPCDVTQADPAPGRDVTEASCTAHTDSESTDAAASYTNGHLYEPAADYEWRSPGTL